MFKSNALPAYAWGTFYTFWFLHCLFAIACIFGPLIFQGLNEAQKNYQSLLGTALFWGFVLPPILYLLLKFVPALSQQAWLSFAAPAFFLASILFTVLLFKAEGPPQESSYVKLNEEKTVKGISVRYDRYEIGPEKDSEATYHLTLRTGEKEKEVSGKTSELFKWSGYQIRISCLNRDHSGLKIFVGQE